jgi:hypothetical protein
MIYALTEDSKKIEASPGAKAACPLCKSPVVAKCGPTNVWHWAHDSLADCDSWIYEPKTKWHCNWQRRFHRDDIEVVIERNGERHIADIVGNGDLVIEIQNSPISSDEINKRELFYGKMIWILNGKQFAHNLEIFGFDSSIDMNFLSDYIFYEESKGVSGRVRLIVPEYDDGAIERFFKSNSNFYQQDIDEENVWFIPDIDQLKNDELPSELKSLYIAFALENQFLLKVDDTRSYPVSFVWKHLKRSWLGAQMPIFIDVGPNFMILIIKNVYSNVFDGKIISKSRFLKKYRRRFPQHQL